MTDRYTFASPDISYSALASAEPRGILEWAASTVDQLAVATSFQSSGLAILHMLTEIRSGLPVLFLDTGFHFPETLAFRDRIVEMWDLNLQVVKGAHGTVQKQTEIHGPDLFRRDPDKCCFINKVEPLQRSLEDFDGWISGLRHDQSPLRADTPLVEAQLLPSGKEVLKIHPLARWTRSDVDEYLERHSIPTHPLFEQGFASIGCWPCTRALRPGEDERAGRWDGFGKLECGIHSFGVARGPKETEAEQ